MSDPRLIKWQYAKRDRIKAEEWQAHGGKTGRDGEKVTISPAHCRPPKLVRAGQYTTGGQNYWDSSSGLNHAILDVVIGEWETIWPKVLDNLKNKETLALQECQEFIDEMQKKIDESK